MADQNTFRLEVDLKGLDQLDEQARHVLTQVVKETATDVETRAKDAMVGLKSGRIYKRGEQDVSFTTKGGKEVKFTAFKGEKSRTHQASAPGEAPAVDTGNLKNSIQTKVRKEGLEAEVAVHAEYAAVLEFGGARIAARPFLLPAVAAVEEPFRQACATVLKRALEDGAS